MTTHSPVYRHRKQDHKSHGCKLTGALLLPFIRLRRPALPRWQKVLVSQPAPNTASTAHSLFSTCLSVHGRPRLQRTLPYLPLVPFPTQPISRLQFPPGGYCTPAPAGNKEPKSRRARLGLALPLSLGTATRHGNLSHQQVWTKTLLYLDLLDLCPVYGAGQNPLLKPALQTCKRLAMQVPAL